MKKIHITESQLKYCMDQRLNEVSLNGDEQLASTKDPKQAAQKTIDAAQNQGVNTQDGVSVSFSADSLKKNAGITEEVEINTELSKPYTKKEIQEARLRQLKENTTVIKKKDLFK